MYRVIKYFTDLQDNGRPYDVGSIYPRKGFNATDKRLEELASSNNRQGVPLIEEIIEKKPKAVKESEVSDVTDEDTEEKPKTTRKKRK